MDMASISTDSDWSVVGGPIVCTFQEAIKEDELEEALELKGITLEDCALRQISDSVWEICTAEVRKLGSSLEVDTDAGKVVGSFAVVWFSPTQDLQEASALEVTLNGLSALKKLKARAFTEDGRVGVRFEDHSQAQAYLKKRSGVLKITVDGHERQYSLELAESSLGATSPPVATLDTLAGAAPVPPSQSGSMPMGAYPAAQESRYQPYGQAGSYAAPHSQTSAASQAATPSTAPAAVHASPATAGPAVPRAAAPTATAARRKLFERPEGLAPPGPGEVRVFRTPTDYEDILFQPGDRLDDVYQAARERSPGCVLARLPSCREAVLPSDRAEPCELLAMTPKSLPLVLPAQFQVTLGELGEREADFALLKHLLVDVLGEFNFRMKDEETALFLHRTEAPRKTELVVLRSAVVQLDALVNHRKMAFLSIVGKPREGKSTLLELMRRRCSEAGAGALFKCSDATGQACTKGLWVSMQPLTPPKHQSRDTAVLFLDSEGLFADDGTDPDYFVRLFTITCVLSSVMILNNKISNTVDEGFKAPLAKLAVQYKSFFDKNEWIRDHKPRVLYLARDWNFLQDLSQDEQAWQEASDRLSNRKSELRDSMQFVSDAFGMVAFGTLPSPVTGVNKEDVVSKVLEQGFEQKLGAILGKHVWPHLSPKKFESEGSPCFLKGSEPLLELLQNTVKAVSTECLPWPATLQKVREKVALDALDGEVQKLAAELEGRFNYLEVLARSDPNTLKELVERARQAELEVSQAPRLRVCGPLEKLQGFVRDVRIESVQIVPFKIQDLMQRISEGSERLSQPAEQEMTPLGYTPEAVANQLQTAVEKHMKPLLLAARSLCQCCVDLEIQYHVQGFKAAAWAAKQAADLQMLAEDTRQKIRRLADEYACGQESFAGAEALLAEETSRLLGQSAVMVQKEVEKRFRQKLGHPQVASWEEAVRSSDGQQLFTLTMPEEERERIREILKDYVFSREDMPELCRCLPGQDMKDLLDEKVGMFEMAMCNERRLRLKNELVRLLMPFRADSSLIVAICKDFFQPDRTPHIPTAQVLGQLLQNAFWNHCAQHKTEMLPCIAEVQRLLQQQPPEEALLGSACAEMVKTALSEVWRGLETSGFSDYQVAVSTQDEDSLKKMLTEVGIQNFRVQALKAPKANFKVILSQTDLWKITKMKMRRITMFKDLGVWVPRFRWTSEFDETAREGWQQHVASSSEEDNLIQYKDSFEEEVQKYDAGDTYHVGGKEILVRPRFSLVLYPFPASVDGGELKIADGVLVHSFSVLGPDASRIAIAWVEVGRDTKDYFNQPRQVSCTLGAERFSLIVVAKTDTWIWSTEPPADMVSAWREAEKRLFEQCKAEVLQKVRADESINEEEIRELVRNNDLRQEHMAIIMETVLTKKEADRLDNRCRQVREELERLTGLRARVEPEPPSALRARLGPEPEPLSILNQALRPVMDNLLSQVLESEDAELIQGLVQCQSQGSLSSDKVVREMQEEINGAAALQLPRVQNKQKFEAFATLFGLEEERQPDFVAEATGSNPDALDLKAQAAMIYRYGGRRFVPPHILNAFKSPAREEISRVAMKIVEEVFSHYSECRIPRINAPNFKGARAKGFDILSDRDEGQLCYFLLRDTQADSTMRDTIPKYLELVRALPCRLQTDLSPEAAFDELDRFRGPNYAFVNSMWEDGGHVHAILSVWCDKLEIIPLPHFRSQQMAVVTHPASRLHQPAFPISVRETVFFANSMNEVRVEVPQEYLAFCRVLAPAQSKAPPTIPTADQRHMLLADFRALDDVDLSAISDKRWDKEACKELFCACGGKESRQEQMALRVMVMAHTRLACEAGEYTTADGRTCKLPSPGRSVKADPRTVTVSGPRFAAMDVSVSGKDSIQAARDLERSGKVLVLNMANRHNAGGGYRHGSLAQEEDLFRRTTLSTALVKDHGSPIGYPLPEFTPVISEGVYAFRGPEREGYDLWSSPSCFDVISIAAYNGNKERGRQKEGWEVMEGTGRADDEKVFTEKGFWCTLRNIASLLDAAAAHHPDHLVLSALGCGAFENNPRQVASIFHALLPAYAGHFKSVEFAILDKNPDDRDSNVSIFRKILLNHAASKRFPAGDGQSGFSKIMSFEKVCPKLGLCENFGDEHMATFWHPDLCGTSGCDATGDHARLWRHQNLCPNENCKIMFGPDNESKRRHEQVFKHKTICLQPDCRDRAHLHPPPCKKGMTCKLGEQRHADGFFYSHSVQKCPRGTLCSRWSDPEHRLNYSHPFNTPCEEPLACDMQDRDHMARFSHVCPSGSACDKLSDPTHLQQFFHLRRRPCPDGVVCGAHNRPNFEDHLNLFEHVGVNLKRDWCTARGTCARGKEHVQKYAHPDPEVLPASSVWGHNTKRNFMENEETLAKVSFHRNASSMIDKIKRHLPGEPAEAEKRKAVEFFSRCRPVHRLPVKSFAKVLKTGFLASHHCLQTRNRDSEYAMQLPSVVALVEKSPKETISDIQEFVDLFLKHEALAAENGGRLGKQQEKARQNGEVAVDAVGGRHAQLHDVKKDLDARRQRMLIWFAHGEVQTVETELKAYLQAFDELQKASDEAEAREEGDPIGIGHQFDRLFETNKMVFAILGPHTLDIYGEDKDDQDDLGVHLVLQPESLYHPDVFCTPMAATFYNSGHGDPHRPWWKRWRSGEEPNSPFEKMASEKLHPSSPLFNEALAMEFMARAVHQQEGRQMSEATAEGMAKYLKKENAHLVVECHLPYVTPLTWVESVIMSRRTFQKMSKADQDYAQRVFRTRLQLVDGDTQAKEAQWTQASARPLRPLPHPSFAWTSLVSHSKEVVLPVQLQPKRRTRIFFRASRPTFEVYLASERTSRILTRPITFQIAGLQCLAREPTHNKVYRDLEFNKRVGQGVQPVLYCLDINGPKSSITLSHAGASSMISTATLEMTRVPTMPTYVSFRVPPGYISFTDVRVLAGEDDKYLYEHEGSWRVPEEDDVADSADRGDGGDGSVQVGFESAPEQGMLQRFIGLFKSGPSELPLCDKGIECELAHDLEHMKGMRHLCLHGRSCRQRDDAEHMKQFVHLEKPECPSGGHCALLSDVDHRAKFHHSNMWDLLRPCRYGRACRKIQKDQAHCWQYHHDRVSYDLTEQGLRLVQKDAAPPRSSAAPPRSSAAPPRSSAAASSSEAPGVPGRSDSLDFTAMDVEPDQGGDMADIYNTDAIAGQYGDAQKDQYGNPIGGGFDLAKDGAFKGFRILVLCAWRNENLPQSIDKLTVPELKKKGFEVKHVAQEDEFTKELRNGRYHVAWIISSNAFNGDKDAFVSEVQKFHEKGRGLMIWGDNQPFYVHANLILSKLFGFNLTGNTPGDKELVPGNPLEPGRFGGHPKLCAGMVKLHEGITICYPDRLPSTWKVFGTSSNNHPVLISKEASSEQLKAKEGTGRVIVDNGWTKLIDRFWTTAGTPRYVSNCSAWLVLRERFKHAGWGFEAATSSTERDAPFRDYRA